MASEHDAFFASPGEYNWSERQIHMIDQMPRYEEFSTDPTSLLWLQIAFMDRDATISERLVAVDALRAYWRDHWDYDFDDFFDWIAWREWISS